MILARALARGREGSRRTWTRTRRPRACDRSGPNRGAERVCCAPVMSTRASASTMTRELSNEGLIRLHSIEGDDYLEIVKWQKHPKIDRPSPSKIPRELGEWAALKSAPPVRQSARLRFGWRPFSPGNNNRQAGSPSRAPSNPLTPG
jgi:hypothetical protein